ncbi:MAG: FGGY-family carbohydrate kinase [Planctomycetaceae bacterium]|nr:FGGY-family carbohydrate kinase [Planctomycetaceae bacterium]
MAQPYVVSIDQGTTNAKAAVVGLDGSLAATASQAIPLLHVEDNGVEQDPEVVWDAIKTIVRSAVRESGVAPSDIVGLICSTQYSSIIPVDADGRPTMNMVTHMDGRATAAKLKQLPGYKTDNPLRQLKWVRRAGLFPLSTGQDSLSHMRLIKYRFPEVYERTHKFLEPCDFLTMRFSGRITANQCTSLMMLGIDNNSLGRIEYDPDLIRMSRIDADKWPELVPVNSVVGTIRTDVADELGLSPETKIISGANDTQVGGVATGTFSGTHAAISIGTTGVMIAHVDRRKTDPFLGMISMPSPVPDTYFLLAENGIAGKVIEYFLTKLVYPNDGFGDHSSDEAFAALDEVVASVPPGSNGVLFLPWLSGVQSPTPEPSMRGAVMNLNLETTRADLARAAIESLMMNLQWLREGVEKFCKREMTDIIFYGGGAKSREGAQIMADVFRIPVHQAADPEYVVVRGGACLAFKGLGLLDFDEIPDRLQIKEVFKPRPETRDVYADHYTSFRLAFKKMRPLFKRMNPHQRM